MTPIIAGDAVFRLHAQDGFPSALTRQITLDWGLVIDEPEFERLMREHEEISRGKAKAAQVALNASGHLPKTDDSLKYATLAADAAILGWVEENTVVTGGLLLPGKQVGLITDRTSFYAEQGGQVGDTGTITAGTGEFVVENTQKLADSVLHVGSLPKGMLEVRQDVKLQVTPDTRLDTMR